MPLNVTEYFLFGARLSDGVKVAVKPSQATVPATSGPWSLGPDTVKVFKLIDRQRIGTLKVTKTVVSEGTLVCSDPGIEASTLGFPCGRLDAASRFCAPARPATHITSNNMVIDILLTMTLSLIVPDALRTETSTVPSKGKRRPGQCESAQHYKRKVRAPSAFAEYLSGVIEGMWI